ncbi:MAG: hypothetical protein A2Y57_00190 [Candidatus Woykebacteria bacterium RBG_13_40_7b]|uniref:Sugar dehydrogenase n=1 Tax=Candidatus Woykebacteria bacterium RBG_13_40_7b TaxID=1802594 RepID=A0A1G1W650_9BACT|nr:MAG: hypothetical protein A2Y57_00190 [Candidatus Woykebacteria bacterium RBG_13_40_7b]
MVNGLLKDRVVIVTGGASGIGLGISHEFVKNGAKVVTASRGKTASIEKIARGVGADFKLCDLSKPKDIDLLINYVINKYKKIDILINNAGIGSSKKLFEITLDDLDNVINTNLKGSFLLTQKVSQQMIKFKSDGKIIFVTSIHQDVPLGDPIYSASKAALKMLVKEMALELAPFGIRVNGIAPGAIKVRGDLSERFPDVPLGGNRGEPTDIAKAALFLVSDQWSKYITGSVLTVDGGLSLVNWIKR